MKIIKLKAENIKKIKAVEIEPKENTVIVSGKNGQGKTSVLDSIWYALGGTKAIPEEPIRKGEKRAEVTIDLDDMIVSRKWTSNSKSYLQITNKDGAVFPSPQKMLDKLIGDLSFDPLEFVTAEKEKQVKILLESMQIKSFHNKLEEISGIKVNSEDPVNIAFNNAYGFVFDNRTLLNREVKSLQTKLNSIELPASAKESDLVSIAELYQQKDKLEKSIERWNEVTKRMSEIEGEIEKLKRELETLNTELSQHKHPEHLEGDLNAIEEKIKNADEINKISEKIKEKKEAESQLKVKQSESESLTDKLDKIKSYKDEIIKSSKMPIDGLDFSNGNVTYNELPFDQLSSSEQLKISLAIAMSLNPELKVIRITDGSLLDNDSMAIIREMSNDKDYQVWIEVVDDTGKLGIYIEDGEVKDH